MRFDTPVDEWSISAFETTDEHLITMRLFEAERFTAAEARRIAGQLIAAADAIDPPSAEPADVHTYEWRRISDGAVLHSITTQGTAGIHRLAEGCDMPACQGEQYRIWVSFPGSKDFVQLLGRFTS